MEKVARRNRVLKWQVILGAVVCAIVAFCVLPGSVIAANAETKTVEYVDREWNPETNQVEEITTDENGNPLTHECTVLTKDMASITNELQTGWYVLDRNIKLDKRQAYSIKDGAQVNLILKDDCTLNGEKENSIHVQNGILTIYGQTKGTGKIKLESPDYFSAIEVGSSAILNIEGGYIEATAGAYSAGIGSKEEETPGIISILGGTVKAYGGKKGAGIGGGKKGSCGTVCIYDGTVKAYGGAYGAGIGSGDEASSNNGNIIIVGGTIEEAKGGKKGAGIGGGNESSGGNISIGGGKIKAYGGKYGVGIGSGDDAPAGIIDISGGDIEANGGTEQSGIGGDSEGTDEESGYITVTGGNITAKKGEKSEENDIGNEDIAIYVEDGVVANGDVIRTVNAGIDGEDVAASKIKGTIVGSIAPQNREPVSYIDRTYDGETNQIVEEEKTCKIYESLTNEICKRGEGLTSGWYVLDSDITYENLQSIRIKDGADAHLILKDGCTLTATKRDAIQVYDGGILTIYGQHTKEELEKDNTIKEGKIVADGQSGHAGIGVDSSSTLNIKGGDIEAEGTQGGAGIGGNRGEDAGEITINGGEVEAIGGVYGAGIGGGGSSSGRAGSSGEVVIYDGTVTATGGEKAAGIGSGGGPNSGTDDHGSITINGGEVEATGGSDGAGIGGGNETSGNAVVIDGGKVTAKGGSCGAGIGGGDDAGAGNIVINAGTVTATGGDEAPGIGGDSEGTEDESGYVILNGGDITANPGEVNQYGIGDEKIVIDKEDEVKVNGSYPEQTTEPVEYIDKEVNEYGKIEETTKTCTDYLSLNKTRLKYGLGYPGTETWYVLDKDININGKGDPIKIGFNIDVYGDVNLILKDGCTLEQTYLCVANKGISLQPGSTLNIYGQEEGTGKIYIDGGEGSAAINVPVGTECNIYGGTYDLEGRAGGAAIGGNEEQHCGEVNIYGGTIDAEGGIKGAGIGGGGNYIGDSIAATVVPEIAFLALDIVTGGIGLGFAVSAKRTAKRTAKEADDVKKKADCLDFDVNKKGKNGLDIRRPKANDIVEDYRETRQSKKELEAKKSELEEEYNALGMKINENIKNKVKIEKKYENDMNTYRIKEKEYKFNRNNKKNEYQQAYNQAFIDYKSTNEGKKYYAPVDEASEKVETSQEIVDELENKIRNESDPKEKAKLEKELAVAKQNLDDARNELKVCNDEYIAKAKIYIKNNEKINQLKIDRNNYRKLIKENKEFKENIITERDTELNKQNTEIEQLEERQKDIKYEYKEVSDYITEQEDDINSLDRYVRQFSAEANLHETYNEALDNIIKVVKSADAVKEAADAAKEAADAASAAYNAEMKALKISIGTALASLIPAVGVGALGATHAVNGSGGDGGDVTIYGGTVNVEGGKDANAIGGGSGTKLTTGFFGLGMFNSETDFEGDPGFLDINGGNIIADGKVKGTEQKGQTITLEGVTEEVEVVDINCDYGVDDVKTVDKNELKFYMEEEEDEKLTTITAKDKDGKETTFLRVGNSYNFVDKTDVTITGVEAQDGIYDGSPKTGYVGTPTNEQGYKGEYEFTYYICEEDTSILSKLLMIPTPMTPSTPYQPTDTNESKWKKTTPENSGATKEGGEPVYAGQYKVEISVPEKDDKYCGSCEIEFEIGKAEPKIVENPCFIECEDGEIIAYGGKVTAEVGNETIEIEGFWEAKKEPEVIYNYYDELEVCTYTATFIPSWEFECNYTFVDTDKLLKSGVTCEEKLEEIKELLSKKPEVKDKVRESELIEDEEVRERLLSFIEE